MKYEDLKKKFEINKKVKFKLYSLEYIIEMIDNNVVIYPEIYPQRKSKYFSLDAVMSYFTVYNEPLISIKCTSSFFVFLLYCCK